MGDVRQKAFVEVGAVEKDLAPLRRAGDEVKTLSDKISNYAKESVEASKKFGLFLAGLTASTAIVSKKLVDVASDAQEIQGKFDTVFAEIRDSANSWAVSFADDVGRSRQEIKEFSSGLGDILKPLGFATQEAGEMSKQMVQLALDVASFNNRQDADVVRAFSSALTGEREALKTLGIVISEADVKQEAYRAGLAKQGEELSKTAKAQATVNLLFANSKDAQGDLARTSESFANVQKRLNSTLKNSQEEIGNLLLPVFTEYAGKLDSMVKDSLPDVLEGLKEFGTFLTENTAAVKTIAAGIAGALIPAVVSLAGAIASATITLAPFIALGVGIQKLTQHFGELKQEMLEINAIMAQAEERTDALSKSFVEWEKATTKNNEAFFRTKETMGEASKATTQLLQEIEKMGKTYGVAQESVDAAIGAISQRNADVKVASSVYKQFMKEVDENFQKVATSAELNFSRVLLAQETVNYQDALDETQRLVDVNEQMWERVVLEIATRAAQAGDLGKAFSVLLSSGMSGDDAVIALRNAGVHVTGQMIDSVLAANPEFAEAGLSFASSLKAGFLENINDLPGMVNNIFAGTKNFVTDAVAGITQKVTGFLDQAKARIKTTGSDIKGEDPFKPVGSSASRAKEEVEELSAEMQHFLDANAGRIERLGAKYEKLKGQLIDLADEHKAKVKDITNDIKGLQEELDALTDPNSDRQVDFRKRAAEQVVEIERRLKEEKNDLSRQERSELERQLSSNKDFINSIQSEISEARKISQMDDLSRSIYLFNQETLALQKEYQDQIDKLNVRLAQEQLLYSESSGKIIKQIQRVLHAQIKIRGQIEGATKESLDKEHEMLDEALEGFEGLILDSARSRELDEFMRRMDLVVQKANQAIKAAQNASGLGGVSFSGKRKFAEGGISSGFPTGVFSTTVTNHRGDEAAEAGTEAIVPLSRNRSIPVEIKGAGGRGGTIVQVFVNGGVFGNAKQFVRQIADEMSREISSRNVAF